MSQLFIHNIQTVEHTDALNGLDDAQLAYATGLVTSVSIGSFKHHDVLTNSVDSGLLPPFVFITVA